MSQDYEPASIVFFKIQPCLSIFQLFRHFVCLNLNIWTLLLLVDTCLPLAETPPLLLGEGGINAVDELLHHVRGLEVVNGYLKIQVHWAGAEVGNSARKPDGWKLPKV